MFTKAILVAGAFIAAVNAAPVEKRELVYVTEVATKVTTVPVTTTVWVRKGNGRGGRGWRQRTSVVASVITTAESAEPTTSTSIYVEVTPTPEVSTTEASTPVYTSVAPTTEAPAPAPTTEEAAPAPAPTTEEQAPAPAPTTFTTTVQAPEPTTEAPAPAPTTEAPAPAPTTEAPAPAPAPTTAAPAPADTPVAPSSTGGEVHTGDITYWAVGLGSCGWTNTDDEDVIALPHGMMNNGANPNNNPLCGNMITITHGGASHTAKIVDTCMGCEGASIDLSPSLFKKVAPNGDGRVSGVNWSYN